MSKRNQTSEPELPSLRISNLPLQKRVDLLVEQAEHCLKDNTRINLSVPPHVEITHMFHRLAYAREAKGRLRIEYNDGTLGKPFPVHELWQPESGWNWKPKSDRHLHLGSLSLRHVDYDRHVDRYLLRDKETKHLTQGEVDLLAYNTMLQILNADALHGEFHITIFQAGLEPVAVGMYRAIVEHLMVRREGGLGPMRIGTVFGLNTDGSIPAPRLVWGIGAIQS